MAVNVTSAWQSLYDVISANVSDPKARGVKWIFGTYPDVTAKDFPGFPLIVISPADVREDIITIDGELLSTVIAKIEVFSKSAQQADELADAVRSALRDNFGYRLVTESVDYSLVDIAGKPIHVRTILVRWKQYD